MTLTTALESTWDGIKHRGYYILGMAALLGIPFIIGVSGYYRVPIITDLYQIARDELGLFNSNGYVLSILSLCCIFAVFAMSWDLLSGYAGQFSFGHAMFWGVSGYSAYWLIKGVDFFGLLPSISLDPISAMIGAGLVSSIIALLLGLVALRLKGSYLALITLIVPMIAAQLVVIDIFRDYTGGDYGINIVTEIIPSISSPPSESDFLNFYLLTVLFLFTSFVVLMFFAFSRIGLALKSIREDEEAAESLGINLAFYKILAFVISAFFAGLAGVMYSNYLNFVGPFLFGATFSFSVIIMCVIGGMGTLTGGIIGAFLLTTLVEFFLKEAFFGVDGLDVLVYGVVLIVFLRYLPNGIARAKKSEKRAVLAGIVIALGWLILSEANPYQKYLQPSIGNLFFLFVLLLVTLFLLPTIPFFFLAQIIGIFLLNDILGMGLGGVSLIKAKFLIDVCVGMIFSYYFPKVFKRLRITIWGIWPSVGIYEPE